VNTLTAIALTGVVVLATQSACASTDNQKSQNISQQTHIGLHIPWATGGDRIERDGTRINHPGEWPNFQVNSIRLWDTRTAWLNLEPAQDQYDFTNLDAHLQKAKDNNVDHVTLVLWGTPNWAAQSTATTDANWLGPGSASPPKIMSKWTDFVRTVATKYKGEIQAYEIGNETNVATFWRGTDQQLAAMVSSAARVIKEVDPEALVVAPSQVFVSETINSPRMDSALNVWQLLSKDKEFIDALSFHWYPANTTKPIALNRLTKNIRAAAKQSGWNYAPLWLTEVNRYRNDPVDSTTDRSEQARWISGVTNTAKEIKLDRLYWYAWTDLGPLDFIQFAPDTIQERALERSLS
jgi:hypothetical protein